MNNLESGLKLINEGKRILFSDGYKALEDGSYNLTVRRAQESVELVLKGLLRIIGIEYPKVHDVGEVFVEQVKKKFPNSREDDLEKITNISMRLSQDREPSFYFERLYSREDAKKALKDAEFVLNFVKNLINLENN